MYVIGVANFVTPLTLSPEYQIYFSCHLNLHHYIVRVLTPLTLYYVFVELHFGVSFNLASLLGTFCPKYSCLKGLQSSVSLYSLAVVG